MKALIHTGASPTWAIDLGRYTWGTLPVANRPLLEYWIALCLDLGIRDIVLVLGDGADLVESCLGEGERFGVSLQYVFEHDSGDTKRLLSDACDPKRDDGLLHVLRPCFPHRRANYPAAVEEGSLVRGSSVWQGEDGKLLAFFSDNPSVVSAYVEQKKVPARHETQTNWEALPMATLHDYFSVSMQLVNGELSRYPSPGYSQQEGVCFGYNVVTPRSTRMNAPLFVGNECRFSGMCEIGPHTIIGHHCIVDRGTRVLDSILLPNSYVGANLDIENKIVAGAKLADPVRGVITTVPDEWLLTTVQRPLAARDVCRRLMGTLMAGVLTVVLLIPFLLMYPWAKRDLASETCKAFDRRRRRFRLTTFHFRRRTGFTRLAYAFWVDRYLQFPSVLRGRLWLCGHRPIEEGNALYESLPVMFPAAVSFADHRDEDHPEMLQVDCMLYVAQRSVMTDVRLLTTAMIRRLLGRGLATESEKANG